MTISLEPPVREDQSEPNLIKLKDGSYIQWDKKDGYYRIAFYERRTSKGSDFLMTLGLAMKKPVHNSRVKDIFKFVESTEEYEDASST